MFVREKRVPRQSAYLDHGVFSASEKANKGRDKHGVFRIRA